MLKPSNKPVVIIAIATIVDFQQTEGVASPLAELFDLGTMERSLKKQISPDITITDIEQAFEVNESSYENKSCAYETELVQEIIYSHEHILEKACALTKLYHWHTITNEAVRQKIIRNIGYLLFSREVWFQGNSELAQSIFHRNDFDGKFFSARCNAVVLYSKKTIV